MKTNLNNIIFYAFRYALGRRTYVTCEVSDCIINEWEMLTRNTKQLIIKEIKEAIKEGNAGMKCDIDYWKRILLLDNVVKENE